MFASNSQRAVPNAPPCHLMGYFSNVSVTGLLSGVSLALLLILAVAPRSMAQVVSSATLRGVVRDQSGGLVANATVTIRNLQRGEERDVKTSEEGAFGFTSVSPGNYRLQVEATGFKKYQQNDLTLSPSDTRALDIALEVGLATETVTVVAETAPIKLDTGERSDTISAKQIDNLSIIGRSSLELLRILPGVVAPDPGEGNLDFVTFGGGANANERYTVNGIRGVSNSVTMDGSRLMDIGANNGMIITPNNDMVQEVTVKTSNYAAEYGSSGVATIITTKSGGKDFHGEVYDYIRPLKLQASDRSNTIAGAPRPKTSFSYPGGNIGGPLYLPRFGEGGKPYWGLKDKLFFFVGLEFQRQIRDPGTKLGTVPTLKERNGDFSSSVSGRPGNTFCPPDTLQFNGCTAVPGANYVPFRDPIGAALVNLFPLPNFAGTGAQSRFNYSSAIIAPENRVDLKMRFDYKVSDNTSVYLRLARETEGDDSPYGIWWGPSTFELPSHLNGTNLGRSAAANITTVLSPTMTNEVVISVSKLKLDYDFVDPSKVSKAALGVSNLQLPWGGRASTPYAPLALISWDVGSHLWEPGGIPLFAFNDSYAITDSLSKIHGNHTLKFGGYVERARKTQNLNGTPEGQIEYEGMGQARTSGNAFANLYTGRINGIDQTTNVPSMNFRYYNIEGYAQDSWKIKPNVTIEFGSRVSLYTNNTEQNGLGVVFDPKSYVRGAGPYLGGDLNRPNGFLMTSRGEIPKSVFKDNAGVLFAPRLNIAWDIFKDGSTVLRGGGGLFHNRVQGNYQYVVATSQPNLLSVHADSWGAPGNDITLSNLSTFNPAALAPGANCRAAGNCPSVSTQDLNSNVIPRTASFSLSLARRLPYQHVLEVAYVGTFGRHLPQSYGYNFVTTPVLSGTLGNADLSNPLHRAAVAQNAVALSQLLPYPDYNGVKFGEFIGTSNYHSLQATLNRQLGKRLQYFVAYTFSKVLGTTSINESDGDQIVDPFDTRGRSYGILSFDRTHILNVSYNYELPNLARGSFDNWFAKGVLNGWQASGITTIQSGRPIKLKFSGDITSTAVLFSNFGHTAVAGGNSGTASGVAPIILRNPQTGDTTVGGKYLDAAAIQIPAFGTTGPHQAPFYIRSPTTSNFDFTVFKNFAISETTKFQFRLGLFNVFNQAFPNPDLGDINRTLDTRCLVTAPGTDSGLPGSGVPNGTGLTTGNICDPRGGFRFATIADGSATPIERFGDIISKHGHRRIELAFKFYF